MTDLNLMFSLEFISIYYNELMTVLGFKEMSHRPIFPLVKISKPKIFLKLKLNIYYLERRERLMTSLSRVACRTSNVVFDGKPYTLNFDEAHILFY